MSIAIVTDTACNITPEFAKELGVYVMPLEIIFGEISYKEGFELGAEEFYEKMENSEELPKTSQPNIAEAYELYEKISNEYDEILSLHISGELSGTVQALNALAEEFEQANITIYDTKLVTIPARELVIQAKKLVDQGKTVPEIVEELDSIRKELATLVTLNSLENVVEGGRISKIAGAIVKFIKIKPVISVTDEEIKMLNTVRSSKSALNKLEEHTLKRAESVDYPFKIMIGHANYLEGAEEIRGRFLEKYPKQEIEIQPITAVIGVHTGSEAIGTVVAPDFDKMA